MYVCMLDVAECSIRNAGVHWQRAKHPVRKGGGGKCGGKSEEIEI
jgi:hypothetical protein